jgi:hypothetical protein
MMRFKYLVFLLAGLTVSAAAQEKKDVAPQSSTSVLINGQQIKGKVLEIDGKHFVAVEDLAQSLRGTISYGDGQIALTFSQFSSAATQPPPSQPQPVSIQPTPSVPPTMPTQPATSQLPLVNARTAETGRVKGTLTYFFSFQVGAKPDSGTKVWLVKGRAEIPADQNFVATSTALGTSGNPEQYNAFKYSIADENGYFELLDIPPGEYTLIMQSAHTRGTLKEKTHIFGKGNSRSLRDSKGRVESFNLLIKPGETADASKDFGPDIDM